MIIFSIAPEDNGPLACRSAFYAIPSTGIGGLQSTKCCVTCDTFEKCLTSALVGPNRRI